MLNLAPAFFFTAVKLKSWKWHKFSVRKKEIWTKTQWHSIEPRWLSRASPLFVPFFLSSYSSSFPDANTQRERTRCEKSRHTSRGRVQICTFSLVFFSHSRRRTKPRSDSPRCAHCHRRRRDTFHGERVQTSHLSLADWQTVSFSPRTPRHSFVKPNTKKTLFSSANCRRR